MDTLKQRNRERLGRELEDTQLEYEAQKERVRKAQIASDRQRAVFDKAYGDLSIEKRELRKISGRRAVLTRHYNKELRDEQS